MRRSKLLVWKHSCRYEGQCDPPREDPWQVDSPAGYYWDNGVPATFTSHTEAMTFADHVSKTGAHLTRLLKEAA